MREGYEYILDSLRAEVFFNIYANELKNTQLFCDYAMDILDDLMQQNSYGYSVVYLCNTIKIANKKSFAFCYIRDAAGFPTVERFFLEDEPKRLSSFFVRKKADEKIRSIRRILLKKREL